MLSPLSPLDGAEERHEGQIGARLKTINHQNQKVACSNPGAVPLSPLLPRRSPVLLAGVCSVLECQGQLKGSGPVH